jgi:hypothetical protein
MEIQIKMMAAASEVINFKKKNPQAIHEEIFQHVSDYISNERIKDEKIKLAMIASAGKVFQMVNDNPNYSEKELLKRFVEEIPFLLQNVDSEY